MAADAIPQPALAGPGVLLHAAAPGLSIPALTQWFYRCAHSCPLSITELQAMSTAPPTLPLIIHLCAQWLAHSRYSGHYFRINDTSTFLATGPHSENSLPRVRLFP